MVFQARIPVVRPHADATPWRDGGANWGVKCKYADAPCLTRSMRNAVADLDLQHLWVVYPGAERYSVHKRVTVLPLTEVVTGGFG